MKKYIILFTIISPFFFISCNKWLEVDPKTETKAKVLLSDENGFKDALIGIYQHLGSNSLYGQHLTMGFVDVLGQRYTTSASSHSYYNDSRFNYNDVNAQARINSIWSDLYKGIANLNNILIQVDDKKTIFTEHNFERVKGEALALRALLHFDALRLFGTAPIVNPDAPAIPYVTTFDKVSSDILSVKQVIEKCLNDLETAATLLAFDKSLRNEFNSDPFIAYTRNHMNFWAVKGLQARIHLYNGNKTAAFNAAKVVLDEQATYFPFVNNAQASQAINKERLYTTELLFSLYVFKLKKITEDLTKTNVVNGVPILATTTAAINTLFEYSSGGSSDIRRGQLFATYASSLSCTKYWQEDINAEYLKCNVPLIRLSEIFYIAAETATDTEEGVGYLNKVRTARGLAALATNISAENLQTEILKEYKKETFAEGQLFYYFKRINALRVDGSTLVPNYILPLPENEVEFGNRN